MTRKEAIDYYKRSFAIGESDDCRQHNEVLEFTIKALEQEPILDQIKAEIEQIEINGHIRDVECFRAGINTALNVIDKYKAGSEEI